MISFPSFQILEITNWQSAFCLISFMVFPKTAGLLIWYSVMNVLSAPASAWLLCFFGAISFCSSITHSTMPSRPKGYATAHAMAMLLDASVLSGLACSRACCPAPSIGVLVTAPARSPTVSGAETPVVQYTRIAAKDPISMSMAARIFILTPPCLNDEKNPGPT